MELTQLELAAGTTVLQALRASHLLERHPEIDLASLKVGIWGRLKPLSELLRDRDRVEVYRPLKVDPKEARRQRYRSHREGREAKAGKSVKGAGQGARKDGPGKTGPG